MNEDSNGEVAIEIENRGPNLPLVDAIEKLLEANPMQLKNSQLGGKKKYMMSYNLPNLKMGDFLTELEDHPELRGKPPSGKRATIRRAIAKSGKISKIGDRKASSYMMIPIDHIRDTKLDVIKDVIIKHMMMRGGTISHSNLQEAMKISDNVNPTIRKIQTERVVSQSVSNSQLESALTMLEDERLIDKLLDLTYVCTPEVWGYSPSLKKSSTFTLSFTSDELLTDAVEKLRASPLSVPGFEMTTPKKMSKSAFVDIAIWHTYKALISDENIIY